MLANRAKPGYFVFDRTHGVPNEGKGATGCFFEKTEFYQGVLRAIHGGVS